MTPTLPSRRSSQTTCFWLLLFLVAVAAGREATATAHPASKHNAKREVEALEEQWKVAQMANDLAAIDRLMSDDFIGISMNGQANTKTQQLDRFRNRKLVITKFDLSDRKIKLVGSVAIVTSLAEVEGANEGEPLHGTYRYTRVYQRLSSGIWKTTNFEVTRIPANHRP
jgi:ketosteroid isomerase-like protein